MALGGPVVRQHYVEFIVGTGVKLDGVVDAASTSGPWTWVVPKDVSQIFVTGVGAGGGGGSSTAASPSARGGGGGGSGFGVIFLKCAVAPGRSLTVTVGAKGAAATAGGASTITNLVSSPFDNPTTLDLKGGAGGTSGTAAGGGGGVSGYTLSGGGGVVANAATPSVGGSPTFNYISNRSQAWGFGCGGGGAGSASTTGSTAGANGGAPPAASWNYSMLANLVTGGTGDSSGGTVSRSGGGAGGSSIIGYGGNGGAGGANGSSATGYGAGGGGAGGNGATGGSGSDGYIGIFYWSAD